MAPAALPPPRRLDWGHLIKDAALAALAALVLAIPLVGFQAVEVNAALTIRTRFDWVAIGVAAVFAGRLLLGVAQALRPVRAGEARARSLLALDRQRSALLAWLGVAVAIALPFLPFSSRYVVDLATLAAIYVMLGWGLNVVVGLAGLLDLGYVAFYAVGAYSFALFAQWFHLSFWECLPIAALLAASFGVALGFPVLRLRGDYLAIVTLGFGEIVRIILLNWVPVTNGPAGIGDIPRPSFFGMPFAARSPPGTTSFHDFFHLSFNPNHRVIFLYYAVLRFGRPVLRGEAGLHQPRELQLHGKRDDPRHRRLGRHGQPARHRARGGRAGGAAGAARLRRVPHAHLRRGDGRHHGVAPARAARAPRAELAAAGRARERGVTTASRAPLLEVEHLTMRFGGLVAVDDVSFVAGQGEITGIIGPNGAGKTTMFNCLTGFYKPTVGRLTLHRGDRTFQLEQMEGFRIAQRARVARTFQNIRLFPAMSVLENLVVAQHNKLMRASGFTVLGLFGLPVYRRAERQAVELARFWLEKVQLVAAADQPAGSLPYGAQRRLEIARAMCTEPLLLCLDEPAAGLNPRESAELNDLLRFIREKHGISVLLIEHDMGVVMEISDHIVVLDYGERISDGSAEFVRNDPRVIAAYLGVEDEAEVAAVESGVL